MSLYYALFGTITNNQKSLFRAAKALTKIDHPKAKTTAALFLSDVDLEQAKELLKDLPEPITNGPEVLTTVLDIIYSSKIVNGSEKGTLLELKARGNEYFKAKDFDKAIELYTSAIVQCQQPKALLSNMSLTLLTEKHFLAANHFAIRSEMGQIIC